MSLFYNKPKKGAADWEKSKSLILQHIDKSMLIKSDVLAMTPDGSLYPGSADILSTAQIYLPNA